jgi:hypothetical protein
MPNGGVTSVNPKRLRVINADVIHWWEIAPIVGVPNSVQRNHNVQDGEDEVVHKSGATASLHHHRLHGSIVLRSDGAQPKLLAATEHRVVSPQDEDAYNDTKGCEVGKPSDPSAVIVCNPHEADQTKNNTQAPQDINKPIGTGGVASNQDPSVLCDDAGNRAKGQEKQER